MVEFARNVRTVPSLISTSLLLMALMGGLFLPSTLGLSPIAVGVTLALFLICVWLVPAERLTGVCRFAAWVFVFGTLLNVPYELWHSVFYTHYTLPGLSYPGQVRMLFEAAAGDGLLAVINVLSVTALRRGHWPWRSTWRRPTIAYVITLALVIQIGIELGALATGRWAYDSTMPLIPVLGVGLTPTIQMPLLMLPILSLAQRMLPQPTDAS